MVLGLPQATRRETETIQEFAWICLQDYRKEALAIEVVAEKAEAGVRLVASGGTDSHKCRDGVAVPRRALRRGLRGRSQRLKVLGK